jgi:hypothetical protein
VRESESLFWIHALSDDLILRSRCSGFECFESQLTRGPDILTNVERTNAATGLQQPQLDSAPAPAHIGARFSRPILKGA